jgi:hypothetical protein
MPLRDPPDERSVEALLGFGVVNLDKPPGPSSHQVSAWMRDLAGVERAAQAMSDALVDPLIDFVSQTEDALSAFERMVTGILDQIARLAVERTIGTALEGLLKNGPVSAHARA